MTSSEYEKFCKTMDLTTSTNDHEALTALRKAIGMLTNHGYTWRHVFSKVVRVVDPVEFVEDYNRPQDHRAK